MNTDEVLTLQALKFKQLNTQGHSFDMDMIELALKHNPDDKAKLRNICAFIQPSLFEKIENLCSMLELSKRQFVEMALVDLVAKANSTIDKFDVLPEGE